jgi:hypothetical protein
MEPEMEPEMVLNRMHSNCSLVNNSYDKLQREIDFVSSKYEN